MSRQTSPFDPRNQTEFPEPQIPRKSCTTPFSRLPHDPEKNWIGPRESEKAQMSPEESRDRVLSVPCRAKLEMTKLGERLSDDIGTRELELVRTRGGVEVRKTEAAIDNVGPVDRVIGYVGRLHLGTGAEVVGLHGIRACKSGCRAAQRHEQGDRATTIAGDGRSLERIATSL